jgi:DNA-binding LacI/PurR family transcriptional regulator
VRTGTDRLRNALRKELPPTGWMHCSFGMPRPIEPQHVSLAQIAQEAGVATSTVSRALRGDLRIGLPTRQRIKQIAARLHHRPHPLVAALMAQVRNRRAPSVRWNLAWLDLETTASAWRRDPVSQAFYKGAMERAAAAGYAMERIWVRSPRLQGRSLTDILQERGIKGVLLQGFAEAADGHAGHIPIALEHFSVVSVGTSFHHPPLHFATNDQHHSTQTAVRELWSLGYRKIGYIGNPLVESVVNHRFCGGYLATLSQEFSTPPLAPLVTHDDGEIIAWIRAKKPEAIISTVERLPALLTSYGWCVPKDIGFAHLHVADDDEFTSGVFQQSEAVAAAATDLLIGALANNEIGAPMHPRGVLIPGEWRSGRTVRRA